MLASSTSRALAALLIAFAALASLSCSVRENVTLILHGGKVWTGDGMMPIAEAVAIDGDRIVGVGQDEDLLTRFHTSDPAATIDLEGRLVVPGIIDSHVHLLAGGMELLAPDLRSADSEEEMARRLAEHAATLPPGTWITSGSWDHENWPGAQLPTRTLVDRYVPDHPILVARLDGHMALANSRALEIAGITKDTPDPPGGTIVRDESGEPTGILKDRAEDLVLEHIPPLSIDEAKMLLRAAARHAAELGVTGVASMGAGRTELDALAELDRAGELTFRVFAYVPISELEDYEGGERLSPHVVIVGVKAFTDGSLGSSTALFLEPYLSDPSTIGLALADSSPGGDLERQVGAAIERGLQPAIHAIGDRAIRELLDLYERIDGYDKIDARSMGTMKAVDAIGFFRIEHAQHIHPDDLGRFAKLGVVASMQPYHAIDDGRWAEGRIGAERLKTSYAFRSLRRRAAMLAFGSDWPVAPLSPWEGIYAAVTRRTLDGKHPDGWVPEERITIEGALDAYTFGSAIAAAPWSL
ncbi:MAG TPA: amidohydrolase, partial [Planctomycetota bacterium]|nr:amidohydrolase [Planctomycetota bacterium]